MSYVARLARLLPQITVGYYPSGGASLFWQKALIRALRLIRAMWQVAKCSNKLRHEAAIFKHSTAREKVDLTYLKTVEAMQPYIAYGSKRLHHLSIFLLEKA